MKEQIKKKQQKTKKKPNIKQQQKIQYKMIDLADIVSLHVESAQY